MCAFEGERRRKLNADVLVVGGGLAGCTAAIHARAQGASVILVDKGYVGKSGQTPFANSYLLFNPEWGDDLEGWMEQINHYGEYVNNRTWTELCLKESYERYVELASWGVKFGVDGNGGPGREPARDGKPMGPCRAVALGLREPSMVLRRQVLRSGATIVDRTMIAELLSSGGGAAGAVGIPMDSDELVVIEAQAVVLAAGAGGFRPTRWPINNLTSDADCMAYRLGAEITGKEYVDSHVGRGDWETHRDFGRVVSEVEKEVVPKRPRTMDAEGGTPYDVGLMFLGLEFAAHEGRAPFCQEGRDGTLHPIVGGASSGMSVHKAEGLWPAHTDCSSNVPGLFAAGDSLGTMQSGSVYVALGQSLLGCSVTGARAGTGAAVYAGRSDGDPLAEAEVERAVESVLVPLRRRGGFGPRWVTRMLQNTMIPYYVMYVKHGDRLRAALANVEFFRDHLAPMLHATDPHELRLAHETKNMIMNAEMRLRASLFRTESRGCHYREDYPLRDDPEWLAWVIIKRGEDGQMTVSKRPIPQEWWPDLSIPYEQRYPLRMLGE